MNKSTYSINNNVLTICDGTDMDLEEFFNSEEIFNKVIGEKIQNKIIEEIIFYSKNLNLLNRLNLPSNNIKKIKCCTYIAWEGFNVVDQELNNLPENLEELDLSFGEHNIKNLNNLPSNLKILKLGKINYKLDNLPNKLENLELRTDGSTNFEYLPSSLKNLKIYFVEESTTDLDSLPSSLESLEIYGKYIGQLNNLPYGLKKLYLPNLYQYNIYNIPISINELKIGLRYKFLSNLFLNSKVNEYNLKILRIGYSYKNHSSAVTNFDLTTIPRTIEELELGDEFNQELNFLPQNLKKITFGFNFKHNIKPNDLPETIESIILGYIFNIKMTKYPKNLRYFELGRNFSQNLDNLPNGLTCLVINERFQQTLINLPNTLKTLKFDDFAEFNKELVLPDSLENLVLGKYFKNNLKNIPNNLKTIKFSKNNLLIETKLQEFGFTGEKIYY